MEMPELPRSLDYQQSKQQVPWSQTWPIYICRWHAVRMTAAHSLMQRVLAPKKHARRILAATPFSVTIRVTAMLVLAGCMHV